MLFPGGFVGSRGTHFNSILDATDRSWDNSSVSQIQFDQYYFFVMRSCSHAHALPVIRSSPKK